MLPPGIDVNDLRLDPGGRAGHYLHVPTGEVISVDLSPEMIRAIPPQEVTPITAEATTPEISPLQQTVDILQARMTALELQVAELLQALPAAPKPLKPAKTDAQPAAPEGSDDAKSAP